MCSPRFYLSEEEISEISKFKDILTNDVEEIFKDKNLYRKSNFTKIKETEYTHVSFVTYRGMQTYCAEIPGTEFKKYGPDCKILAKDVDKKLLELKLPAVNFKFKPKLKEEQTENQSA